MTQCYLSLWRTTASLWVASLFTSAALAAGRPLQVLYVGEVEISGEGANYSYLPGQTLAKEAIYFDHRADTSVLAASYLKHFDAVVLTVPESDLSSAEKNALDTFARRHGVKRLTPDEKFDDVRFRAEVLDLVGQKARAEWESFLQSGLSARIGGRRNGQ